MNRPEDTEIQIRPATVRDVNTMLKIINDYAAGEVMLARSPLALYENLRDFLVAERAGEILGCGALHVVWADLAEIRSIAVLPDQKGKGLGMRLAQELLEQAKTLLLPRVFAFTYSPGFFAKIGFREVAHNELPHKVFGDCLNCPKFNACDEIAMLLELETADKASPETGPLSRGSIGLHQGPFPINAPPTGAEPANNQGQADEPR
jgi:amino-acid N-acetyltransferase